jgi:hypothetical protein
VATEGTNEGLVDTSEAVRKEVALSTTEEGSHVRYKCHDKMTRNDTYSTPLISRCELWTP